MGAALGFAIRALIVLFVVANVISFLRGRYGPKTDQGRLREAGSKPGERP